MIFRNDDVSYKTEVGQFKEIHKLFKKYIVLHTVAVICKDLHKNPELVKFIKSNNIDVQIHCWDHYNFTEDKERLKEDLPKCIEMITRLFNNPPDTVYPPWNAADDEVKKICADNNLILNNEKVSLSQFIRFEGKVDCEVVNFHSWAYDDIILIDKALQIYEANRLRTTGGGA